MKRMRFAIAVWFFGIGIPGFAQISNYNPRYIGADEGLSQIRVMSVTEDAFGFIWLATHNGLNRYDGYSCEVFRNRPDDPNSLSDNRATALVTLPDGRICIGNEAGMLDFFDYATGQFSHSKLELPENRFNDRTIEKLFVDSQGSLWIGSSGMNVWRWRSGAPGPELWLPRPTWISKSEGGAVSFWESSQGQLWVLLDQRVLIGLRDWGKEKKENGGYEELPLEILARSMESSEITHAQRIYPYDQKGDTALIVATEGLYFWIPNTSEIVPVEENRMQVWEPYPDREGAIWIPVGQGIFRMNPQNPSRKIFNEGKASLLYFRDGQGNLWGRSGEGAFFFDPEHPVHHLEIQNKPEIERTGASIYRILPSESHPNRLWLLSMAGMYRVDDFPGKAPQVTPVDFGSDKTSSYFTGAEMVREGKFLLLGGGTAFLADARAQTFRQIPGITDTPFAVFREHENQFWLGGQHHIYSLDSAGHILQILKLDSLFPDNPLRILCFTRGDDNALWLGTDNGLYLWDRDQDEIRRLELVKESRVGVKCVFTGRRGELWVGTNGYGLFQLRLTDGRWEVVGVINSEKGLPDDVVYGVLEDGTGNLWMSTNRGLARLEPENGEIFSLGKGWGLPHLEFNTGAYRKLDRGMLAFGGIRGLVWFNPEDFPAGGPMHRIMLSEYHSESLVGRHPLVWEEDSPVEFAPGTRLAAFSFFSTDMMLAEQNRFRYRVPELNESWVELGQEHSVEFRELAPGNYTLEVNGTDRFGRWAGKPLRLSFSLQPYWYQTRLFRVLLGLLAVLAFFILLRRRVRAAQRRNIQLELLVSERTTELREKNEMVEKALSEREALLKEIHHRVKNNLEIISSLLELQAEASGSEEIRAIMSDSINRVMSMAAIHRKLYQSENIEKVAFGDQAQSLLESVRVTLGAPGQEVKLEVESPEIYLDLDTAIPLGLILTELATNSFKYAFSGADSGTISVEMIPGREGKYSLLYRDDGPGLPGEIDLAEAKSLGILLIHDLARQLQGSVKLMKGKGFRILIKFKDSAARKRTD